MNEQSQERVTYSAFCREVFDLLHRHDELALQSRLASFVKWGQTLAPVWTLSPIFLTDSGFITSWTWIYLRNCNFIKCIQLVCLLFVIWTSCQQKPTMTKCFGIRMYIVIEGLDRRLPTQSQCTVISVKRLSYPSYYNNGTSPCSRPLLSRYNSVDHHRLPIARFRNSMDISVWQDYRLHRRFVCSIFIS